MRKMNNLLSDSGFHVQVVCVCLAEPPEHQKHWRQIDWRYCGLMYESENLP